MKPLEQKAKLCPASYTINSAFFLWRPIFDYYASNEMQIHCSYNSVERTSSWTCTCDFGHKVPAANFYIWFSFRQFLRTLLTENASILRLLAGKSCDAQQKVSPSFTLTSQHTTGMEEIISQGNEFCKWLVFMSLGRLFTTVVLWTTSRAQSQVQQQF